MIPRRDVFQAIADPNRRAIIDILAKEEMNVNGIADKFKISRPAISKHIRILSECGLLKIQTRGKDHIYKPDYKKLQEVSGWVNKYQKFWSEKLDDLDKFLQQNQ